MQTTFTNIKYW